MLLSASVSNVYSKDILYKHILLLHMLSVSMSIVNKVFVSKAVLDLHVICQRVYSKHIVYKNILSLDTLSVSIYIVKYIVKTLCVSTNCAGLQSINKNIIIHFRKSLHEWHRNDNIDFSKFYRLRQYRTFMKKF